jgi:hypothetical protein
MNRTFAALSPKSLITNGFEDGSFTKDLKILLRLAK